MIDEVNLQRNWIVGVSDLFVILVEFKHYSSEMKMFYF